MCFAVIHEQVTWDFHVSDPNHDVVYDLRKSFGSHNIKLHVAWALNLHY